MLNLTVHRELSWICWFSHTNGWLAKNVQFCFVWSWISSFPAVTCWRVTFSDYWFWFLFILFSAFRKQGDTSGLSVTALLFQPRRCMATDGQQWEWAANQLRPLVATWRRVRGTRSGSCRAGSEAPSPSARRGSCSSWWRRRSAGWSGRVRCVSLWHASFFNICTSYCGFNLQSKNKTSELSAVRFPANNVSHNATRDPLRIWFSL